MSNRTGTPTPWHVFEEMPECVVFDGPNGPENLLTTNLEGYFCFRAPEDARKAAAAPELLELSHADYRLSMYAASIHWGENDTNTADWLEGLREQIEGYQDAYDAVIEKLNGKPSKGS